jgi:hypothetical protein
VPTNFMCLMNDVLQLFLDCFAIFYLNIIIFIST